MLLRCRTKTCDDWRIYTYGYSGEAERDTVRRITDPVTRQRRAAFPRSVPTTQHCSVVVSMVRLHSSGF